MSQPTGVAVDSFGNLWVAEYDNNRVLEFQPPFTYGESASLVIGADSFTALTHVTNQSGFNGPEDVAFDPGGNLWVTDCNNNRVLEFKPPFSNGKLASEVIGQSGFGTSDSALNQHELNCPEDLAFDSSGDLWVVDAGYGRVLEFAYPLTSGEGASVVVGQSSFTTSVAALSQTGLASIWGVAFDSSGNLWVSDTSNNRVLEYSPPFSNGMPASLVLGAKDFTSTFSGLSAKSFFGPQGVAFDPSENLWVSDTQDHRVLEFPTPLSTGESATVVLGQSSFTTSTVATSQTGMSNPIGIATDSSGNLWVTDYFFNRVVQYLDQSYKCNPIICGNVPIVISGGLPVGQCPPICTVPQGVYELSVQLSPSSPGGISGGTLVASQQGSPSPATDPSVSCNLDLLCGPYTFAFNSPGTWTLTFTPTLATGAQGPPLSFTFQVTPTLPTPEFPVGSLLALVIPFAALFLYMSRNVREKK